MSLVGLALHHTLINFLRPGTGERAPANVLAEGRSERTTTTEFGQKFPEPSEKFELKESPLQGKPRTQLPKGWGQGASPRVPRPEELLAGSEDRLAHDRRHLHAGIREQGDVSSITVTRPIIFQLDKVSGNSSNGSKRGTPL
jgi:hypothetical protein